MEGLLIQLHRVRSGDLISINTEIKNRLMSRAVKPAEAELTASPPDLRVDFP